jgi:hypothetical protein
MLMRINQFSVPGIRDKVYIVFPHAKWILYSLYVNPNSLIHFHTKLILDWIVFWIPQPSGLKLMIRVHWSCFQDFSVKFRQFPLRSQVWNVDFSVYFSANFQILLMNSKGLQCSSYTSGGPQANSVCWAISPLMRSKQEYLV